LQRGSFFCFVFCLSRWWKVMLAVMRIISCFVLFLLLRDALACMRGRFGLHLVCLGKHLLSRMLTLFRTACCISAACMRFARLYIAYVHVAFACASSVPFFRTRLFGQSAIRMIVKRVADQDERIERLLREQQRNTEWWLIKKLGMIAEKD